MNVGKNDGGIDYDEDVEERGSVESQGFEGVQVTANEWFPR